MVKAWVVEVSADERRLALGIDDFIQLPAPGDRVAIPNARGSLDVMGVVQIEHAPARIDEHGNPDREPMATVYAQWMEEDGANKL
jgi:hypothetical protein